MLIFFLVLVCGSLIAHNIINIHTIGDSHSRWPHSILSKIKYPTNLQIHAFLGKSIHGAIFMGIDKINFDKFGIENDSIVMFTFGEVDSRAHLHKFKDVGLYKEVVRLVSGYEKLILANLAIRPTVKIWIGGLTPPADYINSNLGSAMERFLYSRLLNEEILRMAKRNNFFFLDNYSDYADEHGFLRKNISDGNVHIINYCENTKIAIANEIEKIKIK